VFLPYRVYLKWLDKLHKWVHHTKKKIISIYVCKHLALEVQHPCLFDLNPLDFCLWRHLKTLVYSATTENQETLHQCITHVYQTIRNRPGTFIKIVTVNDQICPWIHWFRWSLSNHSQPPQHLLKILTAHDHMCPCMHWFICRTFWAFILNCDLINNNSTVIKLGTCILNALCMIYIQYYIVKVFIVECNFSIKFKNHPFPDTCSYELSSLLWCE